MPIHAQKASCYYGWQFLKSHGFKTSYNDFSMHETGNYFMAICIPGEKLLQKVIGVCIGR